MKVTVRITAGRLQRRLAERAWGLLLAATLILTVTVAGGRRERGFGRPEGEVRLAVTSASLQVVGNLAQVTGRVKNLAPAALESVSIGAELLDGRGEVIGRTAEILLEPARLEPGQSASFELLGAGDARIAFCRLHFSRQGRRLVAWHETVEISPRPAR